ncbi:HEPN domain-containing protein [Siphonobacter sp. SORGH_AS_0500]|uniref:HEPN domain-containing protein n=1 Tax=Siphonobacter sp. SORGH_AS_0500 TaxID=1864824 RepID=UPI002861D60F|nr:HEPN domain-containing protein [Siphonobacter sp. SORGH_AS_0500]MDR6195960.1 hypothetical protein [Siphonobacter sp. SORGH_AS_0500]
MIKTPYLDTYLKQLQQLKHIINSINKRIISEPVDDLIYENSNFFNKSFLVTMCAYLESYLKDSLMVIINEINSRLITAKLPHNLIRWHFQIDKELKENEIKYENLKIGIKKSA